MNNGLYVGVSSCTAFTQNRYLLADCSAHLLAQRPPIDHEPNAYLPAKTNLRGRGLLTAMLVPIIMYCHCQFVGSNQAVEITIIGVPLRRINPSLR